MCANDKRRRVSKKDERRCVCQHDGGGGDALDERQLGVLAAHARQQVDEVVNRLVVLARRDGELALGDLLARVRRQQRPALSAREHLPSIVETSRAVAPCSTRTARAGRAHHARYIYACVYV